MKKQTCFELKDAAYPIKLEQTGIDSFTVTYGKQVKARMTYGTAAWELGSCIMHAAACEGKLDNREKGEK